MCGPGWKNQLYRNEHYLMNGLCYALDGTRSLSKPYAPLADNGETARQRDSGEGTKGNWLFTWLELTMHLPR